MFKDFATDSNEAISQQYVGSLADVHTDKYTLLLGDCLDRMKEIPDGSVDMILCDLPYSVTSNSWDSIIPFISLWDEYNRVCNGMIVLTAAQPFTSALIMSNQKGFRHTWTWIKKRPTGFQNAKKMPLRATEDIVVFGKTGGTYNPQGITRIDKVCTNSKSAGGGNVRGNVEESSGKGSLRTAGKQYVQEFTNYPKNVLEYGADEGSKIHPTQKPVALMEYLIKTYSSEGDTILDNCFGSGTTGVACLNTNRKFIGIEMDENYFNIASKRIAEAQLKDETNA